MGAALYHALNGLRIIVMDFWPQTTLRQKQLFYTALIVFIVLYIPDIAFEVAWMLK